MWNNERTNGFGMRINSRLEGISFLKILRSSTVEIFHRSILDLVFELFLFKSNYLIQIKIEQMSNLRDVSLNNCAVFNHDKSYFLSINVCIRQLAVTPISGLGHALYLSFGLRYKKFR